MSAIYQDRELLYRNRGFSSFRWSAVFAGLACALGFQVLLMAVGAAIGVTAGIPATQNQDATARGLGIGAGIWMVFSPIVSLMIGGFVASYLSRPVVERGHAVINGVMVWAMSLVAGALIVGSAATAGLSSMLGGATSGATIAAADTSTQPRAQREELKADAKRAKADTQRKLDQNREEIQAKASDTAKVATGVSWAGVFAMLLSLGASIFGALIAVPEFFRYDRRRHDAGAIRVESERETAHSTIVTPGDERIRPDELH